MTTTSSDCERKRRGGFATSVASLACFLLFFCSAIASAGEEKIVGFIDIYGLCNVTQDSILKAVELKPGDVAPDAAAKEEMVRKLEALPGVNRAAVTVVSGPLLHGNAVGSVVYIGIDEGTRRGPSLRAPPTADVALSDDVVSKFEDFERAFAEAMRRGHFSDDCSRGYSLMGDEAARVIQKQFVPLADRHLDSLLEVLQTAKSARQRAIAAYVVGYASDKQAAARALALAARDSNDTVRNNAMRALSALVHFASAHRELELTIPSDDFVEMLDSLEWTDRNKAMAILLELTNDKDEAVLAKLRERSVSGLAEMARWKAAHALMALMLLSRVANISDQEAVEAWQRGEREPVIARALSFTAKK